ncbi:unnamed protein product [Adineta ricciae]|uniref:Tetratricopeptide repeat protein n=1 Tax=Adineta ricciae TaxID=249248 RepID=A0A814VI45_ADIRI|nr:unnamed protein product [Adineta ricciae]CAF1394224.1 unnamed protein product [Adineta ricciae]
MLDMINGRLIITEKLYIYMKKNDYANAMRLFMKGANINPKVPKEYSMNHEGVAKWYFDVGRAFIYSQPEKAVQLFEKSLEIRERIFDNDNINVALSHDNIGYTLGINHLDFDRSIDHLAKGKQIFESMELIQLSANSHDNYGIRLHLIVCEDCLSHWYYQKQNYQRVFDYSMDALRIYRFDQDKRTTEIIGRLSVNQMNVEHVDEDTNRDDQYVEEGINPNDRRVD